MSGSTSSSNTLPIHSKETLTRRLIPKWSISKLPSLPIPNISACVHASKPAPKPLPKPRPRSLTTPLLQPPYRRTRKAERSSKRTAAIQPDSLFLTMLPLEIRLQIYSLILAPPGRQLVHILVKQNHLGHFRCRFPYESSSSSSSFSPSQHNLCDPEGKRCLEGWLAYKASHLGGKGQDRRYILKTDDGGEVSLLRTCRMVYAEAVGELYRLNRFHFSDVRDLGVFAKCVVDGRLKGLTDLVLDWDRDGVLGEEGVGGGGAVKKAEKREMLRREEWRQAWRVIGQMEGLQRLRVVLKSNVGGEKGRRERREMGVLMMGMKGLRNFELLVPWDNEDGWESMEGSPWEVIRGVKPDDIDDQNV